MNIVQTYLDAQAPRTPTECAAQIQADTGNWCSLRRLGEWRRGDRPIPQSIYIYMLHAALPAALQAAGIQARPAQIRDLLAKITPPDL